VRGIHTTLGGRQPGASATFLVGGKGTFTVPDPLSLPIDNLGAVGVLDRDGAGGPLPAAMFHPPRTICPHRRHVVATRSSPRPHITINGRGLMASKRPIDVEMGTGATTQYTKKIRHGHDTTRCL
jgi:hypothetical protein